MFLTFGNSQKFASSSQIRCLNFTPTKDPKKRASQVLRLIASQVLFFATCRWRKLELAIVIFDESTIAACRCYFPDRDDMPNFLKLVLTSWTIANSSQRFSSKPLSHAIVPGDDKIQFYQSFANWLEYWSSGSCNFCFTNMKQKLVCEYEYVFPRRLQSDPIEDRFSQYCTVK